MYKFTLTQIVTKGKWDGDEFKTEEFKIPYKMTNWDDLQNLFCTLVDFGPDTMKFEIKKELNEEVDG